MCTRSAGRGGKRLSKSVCRPLYRLRLRSDDSGEDQQCSFSLSAAFLAAHASDHGVYLNQTNGGVTCNQGPKALQAVRGVMAKALPRAPPSLSDLALRPGPMLEAQGQDAEN